MSITTVNGLVAGMQPPHDFFKIGAAMEDPTVTSGIYHSFLYTAGNPGAAAIPASGINGGALTTYAGQVPFSNPVSGNTYLATLSASATTAGKLILCDRLWHNSGLVVTTTTGQAITFPTLPARDSAGATSGADVLIGLEVSTITGNGAATAPTITYTNSAGSGSKTGTAAFPATAVAGTFVPFSLAAGDVGVRSVQTVTLGTSLVSGVIHLVAYRILGTIEINAANYGDTKDFVRLGLPKLYNNTVPWLLWQHTVATATNIQGMLTYAQG